MSRILLGLTDRTNEPTMMRNLPMITLMLGMAVGTSTNAQNCALNLHDGAKSTLSIQTFSTPMFVDPKFMKMNDDKKDEAVAAFNAGVAAGTVPAASASDMVFTLKKSVTDAGDEYAIGYNVAGVDYFSYVVCRNDTLFIARNRGVVLVGPPDNPIGFTIQGVQRIPLHMKVGDVLPSYEDVSMLFPTKADVKLKKKVFSHMTTNTSHEFGWATDSQTGETGFGNYTRTTTKAVYDDIDVDARQTLQFSSHSLQGMNAVVTGEEDVTVDGKTYKAYIIESESWTKGEMKTTYESADAAVAKAADAAAAKMQEKGERKMVKRSLTNELGYVVMYSKMWFVPEMGGAVLTESYDPSGGITTLVRLEKFE